MLRVRDVYPGSASKNLGILTPKNGFLALGNMIRVVHSGSGSWLFTHPGFRGQKGTGSGSAHTLVTCTVHRRYRSQSTNFLVCFVNLIKEDRAKIKRSNFQIPLSRSLQYLDTFHWLQRGLFFHLLSIFILRFIKQFVCSSGLGSVTRSYDFVSESLPNIFRSGMVNRKFEVGVGNDILYLHSPYGWI